MRTTPNILLLVVLALAPSWTATAQSPWLDGFLSKNSFDDVKVSPDGRYLAATIPLEDRTGLAILRLEDKQVTSRFALARNTVMHDFTWVSSTRVLVSAAEKFGTLDQPQATGELFVMDADGSPPEMLVGFRVQDRQVATRIQPKKAENVSARVVDPLLEDERNALVRIRPFGTESFTRVDRMDVRSGRRVTLARAPVQNAEFMTDNRGAVRFVHGSGPDNVSKLYYRSGEGAEWELINDEAREGLVVWPLGFSEDDTVAYLQSEQPQGPDAILAYDTATGARTQVLRDAEVDPTAIIHRSGSRIPVGALFTKGKPRTEFFDGNSADARLYRSLEAAFDGDAVFITSSTRDGSKVLVQAWSDRNPGDFYLYDTRTKRADYLLSRREWVEPQSMAEVRAVEVKARDGLVLHGLLTLPRGSTGKGLPAIVAVHGGPFGIHDKWDFDEETQILARAGYAVLRVNFRGSGNRGRAFHQAGARQWGAAMQDDVTDATRWLVEEGVADPDRVCIYGASYGAYAALMGTVREPGLYRCAAGYVGVFDLPMMVRTDSRETRRLATWMGDWVGTEEAVAGASPNRLAHQIRVPVFLAAGGEDHIAPPRHTELMEQALRKQGVPVESLHYRTEGHGFYVEKNRREYYRRLLAFFDRQLGTSRPGGVAN